MLGPAAAVIDRIAPNPDFHGLTEVCGLWRGVTESPDVIVALGGGSVLDAAKVLAVAEGDFARVRHHLEGRAPIQDLRALPIIAIPTTAGTGSEVTASAAIWDRDAGKKYSLAAPELYPERAIVDPELAGALGDFACARGPRAPH